MDFPYEIVKKKDVCKILIQNLIGVKRWIKTLPKKKLSVLFRLATMLTNTKGIFWYVLYLYPTETEIGAVIILWIYEHTSICVTMWNISFLHVFHDGIY